MQTLEKGGKSFLDELTEMVPSNDIIAELTEYLNESIIEFVNKNFGNIDQTIKNNIKACVNLGKFTLTANGKRRIDGLVDNIPAQIHLKVNRQKMSLLTQDDIVRFNKTNYPSFINTKDGIIVAKLISFKEVQVQKKGLFGIKTVTAVKPVLNPILERLLKEKYQIITADGITATLEFYNMKRLRYGLDGKVVFDDFVNINDERLFKENITHNRNEVNKAYDNLYSYFRLISQDVQNDQSSQTFTIRYFIEF